MKRSKKVFLIMVAIFMAIMIFIGVDMGRRTTFPGKKKQSTTSPQAH